MSLVSIRVLVTVCACGVYVKTNDMITTIFDLSVHGSFLSGRLKSCFFSFCVVKTKNLADNVNKSTTWHLIQKILQIVIKIKKYLKIKNKTFDVVFLSTTNKNNKS